MATDSFYVEVVKRFGFLKLRSSIIGVCSSSESALEAVRKQETGLYILKTVWDGKLFDENSFETDGQGRIFKRTEDGLMEISSYWGYVHGYIYPKAFIANQYMEEDILKNKDILKRYIQEHKLNSPSLCKFKMQGLF